MNQLSEEDVQKFILRFEKACKPQPDCSICRKLDKDEGIEAFWCPTCYQTFCSEHAQQEHEDPDTDLFCVLTFLRPWAPSEEHLQLGALCKEILTSRKEIAELKARLG